MTAHNYLIMGDFETSATKESVRGLYFRNATFKVHEFYIKQQLLIK